MARINEWAVDWSIGWSDALAVCLPAWLSVCPKYNDWMHVWFGIPWHAMLRHWKNHIDSIRFDWTGLDSRALPIQSEALCHHHRRRRRLRCRRHSHHRWWVSNYASNILLLFLVLSCCFCNDNYNCFAILYLPLFPLIWLSFVVASFIFISFWVEFFFACLYLLKRKGSLRNDNNNNNNNGYNYTLYLYRKKNTSTYTRDRKW